MSTLRILFHFTAAHSIPGIKKHGLTLGSLPWHLDRKGNPCLIRSRAEAVLTEAEIAQRRTLERAGKLKLPGFQWLTTNANWEQPFCFLGHLPYPKNAYRLTVQIPDVKWGQLHEWKELCTRCRPDSEPFINQKSVDWDNWLVFYGPIFPEQIVEIEVNPAPRIIASEHGEHAQ